MLRRTACQGPKTGQPFWGCSGYPDCRGTLPVSASEDSDQPDTFKKLGIPDYRDARDIHRQKFLARLSNEIGKRGVIDFLRQGVDHGPLHLDLFCGTLFTVTPDERLRGISSTTLAGDAMG